MEPNQEEMFLGCAHMAVLEMKIWIYWSESNSWIYFDIVLNKNWYIYLSNKVLLVLGRRTGFHGDDCFVYDLCFYQKFVMTASVNSGFCLGLISNYLLLRNYICNRQWYMAWTFLVWSTSPHPYCLLVLSAL